MQLFFEKLSINQSSDFFTRINYLREQACINLAQEILQRKSQQPQSNPTNNSQGMSTSFTVKNTCSNHNQAGTATQNHSTFNHSALPTSHTQNTSYHSSNGYQMPNIATSLGSTTYQSPYAEVKTEPVAGHSRIQPFFNQKSNSQTSSKDFYNKIPDMLNDWVATYSEAYDCVLVLLINEIGAVLISVSLLNKGSCHVYLKE